MSDDWLQGLRKEQEEAAARATEDQNLLRQRLHANEGSQARRMSDGGRIANIAPQNPLPNVECTAQTLHITQATQATIINVMPTGSSPSPSWFTRSSSKMKDSMRWTWANRWWLMTLILMAFGYYNTCTLVLRIPGFTLFDITTTSFCAPIHKLPSLFTPRVEPVKVLKHTIRPHASDLSPLVDLGSDILRQIEFTSNKLQTFNVQEDGANLDNIYKHISQVEEGRIALLSESTRYHNNLRESLKHLDNACNSHCVQEGFSALALLRPLLQYNSPHAVEQAVSAVNTQFHATSYLFKTAEAVLRKTMELSRHIKEVQMIFNDALSISNDRCCFSNRLLYPRQTKPCCEDIAVLEELIMYIQLLAQTSDLLTHLSRRHRMQLAGLEMDDQAFPIDVDRTLDTYTTSKVGAYRNGVLMRAQAAVSGVDETVLRDRLFELSKRWAEALREHSRWKRWWFQRWLNRMFKTEDTGAF